MSSENVQSFTESSKSCLQTQLGRTGGCSFKSVLRFHLVFWVVIMGQEHEEGKSGCTSSATSSKTYLHAIQTVFVTTHNSLISKVSLPSLIRYRWHLPQVKSCFSLSSGCFLCPFQGVLEMPLSLFRHAGLLWVSFQPDSETLSCLFHK